MCLPYLNLLLQRSTSKSFTLDLGHGLTITRQVQVMRIR